ncbi:darobactin family peptide antibiotic [Yersinia aleksiciae]|nr:darobactin family peptide antibiotic [Yersinia aleksiciae]
MEFYMSISFQHKRENNDQNLLALKSKLQSLGESFSHHSLYISNNELDKIRNSLAKTKITAWNWSKSFTEN